MSEIDKLKTENDRLKSLFYKEQDLIKLVERTQDDYEKCILQKEHFERRAKKAEKCLQEIRAIAEYSIMHNENLNSNYQIILKLITKLEV